MSVVLMRQAVAAMVSGLVVLVAAWGLLIGAGYVVSLLPEFIQPAVAAIGGVAWLVSYALCWWALYNWLSERLP